VTTPPEKKLNLRQTSLVKKILAKTDSQKPEPKPTGPSALIRTRQ